MLVSLNDMKNYLGIPLVDTTYDQFLTDQLELISDILEAYCRRKFLSASYTQTFYRDEFNEDTQRLRQLILFHYPLTSITSVTADGELVTADLYRFNESGILMRVDGSDWKHMFCEDLVVEYTSGYADTPSIIKNVVFTLVSERYNKKKSGIDLGFGNDVQRVSIPGVMSIDFDYTLQSNERKSTFGMILGNWANALDYYRSERAILGTVELNYVV